MIIIALLEIDYPPDVGAFFQGFKLVSLSMPKQLNFVERLVPSELLTQGETSERYQTYGFESTYFIVQ